jgi:hypothetical protein
MHRVGLGGRQRNCESHPATPTGSAFDVEFLPITVQLPQSCPGVAQSESLAFFLWLVPHPNAIIRNFDSEGTVVSRRVYVNATRRCGLRDTVPDRVLDQRLQD